MCLTAQQGVRTHFYMENCALFNPNTLLTHCHSVSQLNLPDFPLALLCHFSLSNSMSRTEWLQVPTIWSTSANLATCAVQLFRGRKNSNPCIIIAIKGNNRGLSWLSHECYTAMRVNCHWVESGGQRPTIVLSVLGPTGVKRSPILRLHNVAGQKAGDLGEFKSKEVLQPLTIYGSQ